MGAYARRTMSNHLHPGQKVVHRNLDASNGLAKVGVVTETVGDELAIARWRDGDEEIGFDSRELQPLVNLPLLSRGPVLTIRQLRRFLRRQLRRL